jgi:DivIVA domain-containing protein
MALDRQSIEKKDFPVGGRGYDPEAVDAHLSALADEIAEYKQSARRRTDTMASSASDQVRSIVEAAETSAADIQREAESEAREIRDEASTEAQATRDQAAEQAREYVGKVSESTNAMRERLNAMEQELGALVESLRTGSDRLSADLQLLEGSLTEVSAAVAPRPRFEAESEPAPEASFAPTPELVTEPSAAGLEPAEVIGGHEYTYDPADGSPLGGADDTEGARLIALNMALNGTPRDETARYLSENFQLSDAASLLDEVYASVEG